MAYLKSMRPTLVITREEKRIFDKIMDVLTSTEMPYDTDDNEILGQLVTDVYIADTFLKGDLMDIEIIEDEKRRIKNGSN